MMKGYILVKHGEKEVEQEGVERVESKSMRVEECNSEGLASAPWLACSEEPGENVYSLNHLKCPIALPRTFRCC